MGNYEKIYPSSGGNRHFYIAIMETAHKLDNNYEEQTETDSYVDVP